MGSSRQALSQASVASIGILLCVGGCNADNWVDVTLGTDVLCAQHENGNWDCFGEATIDMPRRDYVAMTADHGVACGIRPEDSAPECFGEGAPSPPTAALSAIRLYVLDDGTALIGAITVEGERWGWTSTIPDWENLGGQWDSFTENALGESAFQAGDEVQITSGGEPRLVENIAAFDIGEIGYATTWIGTDGCFRASGTSDVGSLEEEDCDGPFQPVVVGGDAGNYALDESGAIRDLQTIGSNMHPSYTCSGPKGTFSALARGGIYTCAVRVSGGLVCWVANSDLKPDWLKRVSERYVPSGWAGDCE